MARKKRGHDDGGHGDERWLLTYSDMITLLLALFIVLFAMSTIDPLKFSTLRTVLSDEFKGQVNIGGRNLLNASDNPLAADNPNMIKSNPFLTIREQMMQMNQQKVDSVEKQVKRLAQQFKFSNNVQTVHDTRGLVIRLDDDVLFTSGSATINPEGVKLLNQIAASLKQLPNEIGVEGHTDGAPIHSAQFRDNYDLSFGRAYSVQSLFISNGIPRMRTHLTAWADTHPILEPHFPTESISKNRRVEIVLEALGASDNLPGQKEQAHPDTGAATSAAPNSVDLAPRIGPTSSRLTR